MASDGDTDDRVETHEEVNEVRETIEDVERMFRIFRKQPTASGCPSGVSPSQGPADRFCRIPTPARQRLTGPRSRRRLDPHTSTRCQNETLDAVKILRRPNPPHAQVQTGPNWVAGRP